MAALDDLRKALTGATTGYPDTVADRLDDALEAMWRLVDGVGLTFPTVAGTATGPWHPGTGMWVDVHDQVCARFTGPGSQKPRSIVEKAQQLEHLARAYDAYLASKATARPPASKPPATKPPAAPATAAAPAPLWVGTIPKGATTVGNDGKVWGNVQRQRIGGNIVNGASGIKVVDHSLLGPALELRLGAGDLRAEVEAAGAADEGWGPGTERWCGFDFVLPDDFPLASTETFAIISQVHQASESGSPPLEFDVHSGGLWIRGSSTGYNRRVCDLAKNRVYRIVFGVKVGAGKGTTRLDVVVDSTRLVENYKPPVDFGPPAYWKTATSYASSRTPRPFTTYQNRHRIGASYLSVA